MVAKQQQQLQSSNAQNHPVVNLKTFLDNKMPMNKIDASQRPITTRCRNFSRCVCVIWKSVAVLCPHSIRCRANYANSWIFPRQLRVRWHWNCVTLFVNCIFGCYFVHDMRFTIIFIGIHIQYTVHDKWCYLSLYQSQPVTQCVDSFNVKHIISIFFVVVDVVIA